MQRWYWCGQSSNVVSVDNDVEDSPDYGDRAAYFEPTVSDRNIGIKIRNLTKVCSYSRYVKSYSWHSLVLANNRIKL